MMNEFSDPSKEAEAYCKPAVSVGLVILNSGVGADAIAVIGVEPRTTPMNGSLDR